MKMTNPWNKCDYCGKFIGLEDLVDGLATRVSYLDRDGSEQFENKCKDCYYKEENYT